MMPERKKCLLRLPLSDSQPAWFHASPRGDGELRLRRIPLDFRGPFRDMTPEAIDQEHPGWKQYTLREVGELINLPVSSFPVDEPTSWLLVAERMEKRIQQQPTKIIPVTTLRRFYGWLRDRPIKVEKEFLHASLAEHFLRHPGKLVDLFVTSCAEFQPYDNRNEGFVEGRDAERFLATERAGTDPLVKQFQAQSVVVVVSPAGEIRLGYVDREVGTRRSSKNTGPWLFADGRPATESGAGGMDLLLVAHELGREPCPVVGEIKVQRDETPFFALIQVLTYAAELCTLHQIARLRRSYPAFSALLDKPGVELVLLFSELPLDYVPIRATTQALVAELYRSQPRFGKLVRRVVFLDGSLRPGRLECTCLGVHSAP
ncbi:MAG: hypothetical protein K2R98_31600 [Gemmataceae bacterium]|nr:hypothetical protein [Gemmataceae bacterium]